MTLKISLRILITFSVLFAPVVSLAGEAELHRVEAEWPPAARRLSEAFVTVRGKARITSEKLGATGPPLVREAFFAIDRDRKKVELVHYSTGAHPTKLGEVVYCVGEDTAFEVKRRGETHGYTVGGIGTTNEERDSYLTTFGQYFLAPNGVAGISLPQFFAQRAFKILSAEVVEQAGRSLMEVQCVSGPDRPVSKLTFLLDPAAGWSVRSLRLHPIQEPKAVTSYEIEYAVPEGELPIPRSVKLDRGFARHRCEFTEWDFSPTPASEFNMTHYGLPDMAVPRRSPYTTALLLAAIAIVAAIAGWLLRRLATRNHQVAGD
jgi:hypothetical protein